MTHTMRLCAGTLLALFAAACDDGKTADPKTSASSAPTATAVAAPPPKPKLKGYHAVEDYFEKVKVEGFKTKQVGREATSVRIALSSNDPAVTGVNEINASVTALDDIDKGKRDDVTWTSLEAFKKKHLDPKYVEPPTKATDFKETDVGGAKVYSVKQHPFNEPFGKQGITLHYVFVLKDDYKREAHLRQYDEKADAAKVAVTIEAVARMLAEADVGK